MVKHKRNDREREGKKEQKFNRFEETDTRNQSKIDKKRNHSNTRAMIRVESRNHEGPVGVIHDNRLSNLNSHEQGIIKLKKKKTKAEQINTQTNEPKKLKSERKNLEEPWGIVEEGGKW